MKDTIQKLLDGRAWQTGIIETCDIDFNPEVVKACEVNYCGMYGKTWFCPPAVGSLANLKAKYTKFKYAYVFTTKWAIEDSYDIEGMFEARIKHDAITKDVKEKLEQIGRNFAVLGAGACKICKKCAYPDAPCRFPQKAYPSVEACGIQVMDLSQKLKINYINGENTVTYFSLIFFD